MNREKLRQDWLRSAVYCETRLLAFRAMTRGFSSAEILSAVNDGCLAGIRDHKIEKELIMNGLNQITNGEVS